MIQCTLAQTPAPAAGVRGHLLAHPAQRAHPFGVMLMRLLVSSDYSSTTKRHQKRRKKERGEQTRATDKLPTHTRNPVKRPLQGATDMPPKH